MTEQLTSLEKFPLCVATNQPVCDEFTERALEDSMSGIDIVNAKLNQGIVPSRTNSAKFHEEWNRNVADKISRGVELTPLDICNCTLIQDLPGETWKDIPGYTLYQISDLGRIKYIPAYGSPVIWTTSKRYRGGLSTVLFRNGVMNIKDINSLVLDTFRPITEEEKNSRRLDVVPTNLDDYDHRLVNLERRNIKNHRYLNEEDLVADPIIIKTGGVVRTPLETIDVSNILRDYAAGAQMDYRSMLYVQRAILLYKLTNRIPLSQYEKQFFDGDEISPDEDWREIPDYNGKYLACSDGRICRNFESINAPEKCDWRLVKGGNVLVPNLINSGYHTVCLSLGVGEKPVRKLVHVLICDTFKPRTEEDIRLNRDQVNHIDGNKLNNCAGNLEWTNRIENNTHARQHDRLRHADSLKNKLSALTKEQVIYIRRQRKLGRTCVSLAKELGVADTTISEAATGVKYSDVNDIEAPVKRTVFTNTVTKLDELCNRMSEIIPRLRNGERPFDIAKDYDCHFRTLTQAINKYIRDNKLESIYKDHDNVYLGVVPQT